MGASWRSHKYRVAKPQRRTYEGVQYASRIEAIRAWELDLLQRAGEIVMWGSQVRIKLGEDYTAVVDFVLTYASEPVRYEEIKGYEAKDFSKKRTLWKKYGPGPLHVMKRSGTGWKTEVLQGKGGG